jgi:hypothetical protein
MPPRFLFNFRNKLTAQITLFRLYPTAGSCNFEARNSNMKKLIPFALLVVLFGACTEPTRMAGFDSDTWQQDKKGCQGMRSQMIADFEQIRRDLYGLPEADIKDILGKPDAEQLMSRGQRMFFYYLEPGSQCDQRNRLSEANRAEVRFNALHKVSEITYLRPIPGKQK